MDLNYNVLISVFFSQTLNITFDALQLKHIAY